MQKNKLKIVKIGGNIIENELLLQPFLKDFAAINEPKILIHGGGKSATVLAHKLGLKPMLVDGRRLTDKANLEVAVMVYAGLINKNAVTQLQAHNCNAIGLSGADAGLILAAKRRVETIDYGFVGDIINVNGKSVKQLLDIDLTPVFCAITHNNKGQLLNTNADTIAAEIAIALSPFYQVELDYIFELPGVLSDINNKDSVIQNIDLKTYKLLQDQNKIAAGMLPKLHNCFNALEKGVNQVKIGQASILLNTQIKHTTLTLKS